MIEMVRILLLIALAAAALTTLSLALAWWMQPGRRLERAMVRALGPELEAVAISLAEGRAAGLDFETGQVCVLWDRGASGLVYGFDEIAGAEMIVDGHVVARVQRGEQRRALDVMAPDAEAVTLRLMFDDPRNPEFELTLWDALKPTETGSPAEAMRLGRRWLSHVEALLKLPMAPRQSERSAHD
ncbi:MAG: hypothetical protein ACK4E3_11555 [Brevundimonas sp.]|jgi:hypothetical protein|uniref:hypothetical protein n=1 Tax=Brevundimonas sp. TaxID=1871086 RepID=UPI00391AC6E3